MISYSSVKAKYAYSAMNQQVLGWKYAYYDTQSLLKLVQLLQKGSFYRLQLKKSLQQLRFKTKNEIDYYQKCLNHLFKLQSFMNDCNKIYFSYRQSQMNVIFIFTQFKYFQLQNKLKKYQIYCSGKLQLKQIIQFERQRFQNLGAQKINIQDSQLAECMLIIWQNLYIETILLYKMITFNIAEQEKILQLHTNLVDKYSELDRPFLNRKKIKRQANAIYQLKQEIQTYLTIKKLYTNQKQRGKLKQLAQFIENNHELQQSSKNLPYVFFGFWCGALIFGIIALIVIVHLGKTQVDTHPQFEKLFPIWRGLSYFILYIWLIGINLKVFEMNHIDHRLILMLDHNQIPTSHMCFILAAFFTTVYVLMYALFVFNLSHFEILSINYSHDIPGFLWLSMLGLLLLPVPIFYWRFRLYFFKMILLMLLSPFLGVNFKLHWFCEQFTSFKQPWQDFAYTMKYYFMNRDIQIIEMIRVGQYVTIGFFTLRIIQNFRQGYQDGVYWDTPTKILPRGTLKCGLAILTILLALQNNQNSSQIVLGLWLTFAFITTIYTYHFDLKYDWGLLEEFSCDNRCLNSRIIFQPSFYSTVMVLNLIFRLAWTLNLSTQVISFLGLRPYIFIMIVSYIQLIRRCIWNILKIQRQHHKKCSQFQAVPDYSMIEDKVYKWFQSQFQKINSQKNLSLHDDEFLINLNKINPSMSPIVIKRQEQLFKTVEMQIQNTIQCKLQIQDFFKFAKKVLRPIEEFCYQVKKKNLH